jgi:cullin 3
VLRKHGQRLYESAKEQIREHLQLQVTSQLAPLVVCSSGGKVSVTNAGEFLIAIRKFWDHNCVCIKLTSDILMYMDRVYVEQARVPLMYDAGLILFRDAVLHSKQVSIGSILYDIIINQIKNERNGQNIDRNIIKPVVGMLESLPESLRDEGTSIYTSEFEPRFLQASKEYFETAANSLLEIESDASIYIHKTKMWLNQESERCNIFLSDRTRVKLMPLVESVLIADRISQVLSLPGTGFAHWVDSDNSEDLALVYELVDRVDPTHQCICNFIDVRISETGKEINQQAERSACESRAAKVSGNREKLSSLNPKAISIQWVDQVLTLKDKYDKFLRSCFQGSKNIQVAIEDSFAQFVNENKRVAEFLSLFIDDHLKTSIKGKSDQEIEEILEKAITLFRYIQNKDLFETYYQAHLAKRLLSGKSVSDDAERNLIGKIKREVGTAFTSKLDGMFKDMRVSQDIQTNFKNRDSERLDVDVQVNVLTSTYWPSGIVNSQSMCILPRSVETAKDAFEKYYLSIHSGRVLAWNLALGTADVKARFKKRTHEINMSTMAMVILMLFNNVAEGDSLSFEDIRNATSIQDAELVRHLQSIAVAPKTRLLRKEPMSKDIQPTDKFYFNDRFESPMVKIKVLAVSASNKVENDAERQRTLETVDNSRKYETDAAIVRIMKSRKTLEHVQLVAEVTKQLSSRFKPDPVLIKQRIDHLLEREYLERDSEKRNVYNYVA